VFKGYNIEIQNFDITVVGHFSIDTIRLPNQLNPFISLGGAVTYVSFISKRLGKTVLIISKVGKDFPDAYWQLLTKEGLDLSGIKKVRKEITTSFELEYSKDLNRTLKLRSKNSKIKLFDLPTNFKSKVVHLAPISGEISYDVAKKLKKTAKFLSLDPQGLLRVFSKNGVVRLNSTADLEFLSLVDLLKSSLIELEILTGESKFKKAIKKIHDFGVKIVIVTLGSRGAVLSFDDINYLIPPCKSRGIMDPTGAGDCFIGGFLAEFLDHKDLIWCACVGSASASFIIEKVGSSFFQEKEEIYQRAYAIYEKEIKRI
jgi:sugar/nucleoside kinase (ribokinase family)